MFQIQQRFLGILIGTGLDAIGLHVGLFEDLVGHVADLFGLVVHGHQVGALARRARGKQILGEALGAPHYPEHVDESYWQRDAERILQLHRNEGIDYFKIDSVKMKTPAAEVNFRRFFDRVLQASEARVVFDLDVTAEIRPGYFGAADVGPLFVENRYTDWHRYWPHQTLRNLWMLSQYVDPLRLRMELLNNRRNEQLYTDDPLAPAPVQVQETPLRIAGKVSPTVAPMTPEGPALDAVIV